MKSIVEMPASLPPDGGRVWYFPGAADHGSADVVARIHRRDGTSWLACLARSDQTFPANQDVFALPCSERVYIAGGVADRDDPQSWRSLGLSGFSRVSWSPDRKFVVFNDSTSIHVFGESGPSWSETVGSDIGVSAVTSRAVVCGVYDWAIGRSVVRHFDLATGRELEVAENDGA